MAFSPQVTTKAGLLSDKASGSSPADSMEYLLQIHSGWAVSVAAFKNTQAAGLNCNFSGIVIFFDFGNCFGAIAFAVILPDAGLEAAIPTEFSGTVGDDAFLALDPAFVELFGGEGEEFSDRISRIIQVGAYIKTAVIEPFHNY